MMTAASPNISAMPPHTPTTRYTTSQNASQLFVPAVVPMSMIAGIIATPAQVSKGAAEIIMQALHRLGQPETRS